MTSKIEFFVPGIPVAQPRQRHRVIIGRGGNAYATNYTPKNDPVQDFKATIRLAAVQAMACHPPLDGPIGISINMTFPRPKSLTRKGGNPRRWKDSGKDWDNLGKAVSDALNGIAYQDDQQIVMAWVTKCIAGDGDQIGTRVTIRPLDGREVDLFTDADVPRLVAHDCG